TRGVFSAQSAVAGQANQEVMLPLAIPGTWYVLLYSESAPQPTSFTLTATAEAMQIRHATPNRVADHADITVTLTGAACDRTTKVRLNGGGRVFSPKSMSVDSATTITATFSPLPAHVYDAQATLADGTTSKLPGAVTVIQGGQPHLHTQLIVPSALGYHGTG